MSGRPGPYAHWVLDSPRHRRLAAVAIFAFGLLMAVALSLSDRVPNVAGKVAEWTGLGETARSLSPDHDPWLVVHAVGWAVLSAFLCALIADRSRRLAAAAALLVLAIAIEFGQRVATSSRNFETQDIVANAVGVTAGFIVATLGWLYFTRHRTTKTGTRR